MGLIKTHLQNRPYEKIDTFDSVPVDFTAKGSTFRRWGYFGPFLQNFGVNKNFLQN